MSIKRFTVFGQRCSGTNALIKLIEANFPTLPFCEETGFKHWLVPEDRDIPSDLLVIVIAREVEPWLRSLHRNPWHVVPGMRSLAFSQFIRSEWLTVWDEDFWGIDASHPRFGQPISEELCPQTKRPFANAIAMRGGKLQNWLALEKRSSGFMTVSFPDLINDAPGILYRVAALSGHSVTNIFTPIDSYKGQGNRAFVPKPSAPVSGDDREHIEAHLDYDAETSFGFGG